jgi:hypothetical protein
VTSAQAIRLQATWRAVVGRPRCLHLNQEVERGEKGMVTATYHCLACGEAVLLIY